MMTNAKPRRLFYLFLASALLAPTSLFAADSASIRAPLHAEADPDAVGTVRATLREEKSELIISARNLAPSQTFDVEVGGIIEGAFTTDTRGRAAIRFRTRARGNDALLDFDPRGKTLRVVDNQTTVLQGIVSGNGEDDGTLVKERAELPREDAAAGSTANATFAVSKSGRRTFRVNVSRTDATSLKVFVDGIERGELEMHGRRGAAVFESASNRAGVIPLDFDPRGALIDIVADDKVLFSGRAEARARGVNVASPSVSRVVLASTGADPDGSAHADLRVDDRARKHFSVEVEDVPAGDYELLVDGANVGTIRVATISDRTEGELEFTAESDDDPGELPLTFDPIGKTLTVSQGTTKFFESVFAPNTDGNGVPQPEPASQVIENLASTRLDPDASAEARYEVDDRGRHKFKVEVEDLPVGVYTLTIAGVNRGNISVQSLAGKVEGELEFESESEPGHELLNFDPRGQTIEISSNAGTFFSHLFGSGSSTGGTAATPFDEEVALISTGAAPGAEAKAELQQKENGERSFEVEIEDAPAAAYELLVGGVVRTTINVVVVSEGTRGRAKFETEQRAGALPLNFEVRGQEIIVRQGSTTFFSRTFPSS